MKALALAAAAAVCLAAPASAQMRMAYPALADEVFENAAVDELLEAFRTYVYVRDLDKSCGAFVSYRSDFEPLRETLFAKFEAAIDGAKSFVQSQLATTERYYADQIARVAERGCRGADYERGVAKLRRNFERLTRPPIDQGAIPTVEEAKAYYGVCPAGGCQTAEDIAVCLRVCACTAHRARTALTASELETATYEVQLADLQLKDPAFDPRFRDLPPDARPKRLPPPSEADIAAANVERERLLEGPLLDLTNDCRADIAAGYGRDG